MTAMPTDPPFIVRNDSWLQPLLSRFGNAAITIAPERRDDLAALFRKHAIEFEVNLATPKWIFEGGTGWTGTGIEISLSALESLWMLCYAAVSVYHQFQATGFEQSVTSDEQTLSIARIASRRIRTNQHWELPIDYPRPADGQMNQKVNAANWLFVGSAGFGVLHELGHIEWKHSTSQDLPTKVKFEHEFQADEWAFEWMMSQWKENDWSTSQPLRRNIFVAGLFTLLAARNLCLPESNREPTHPNVIDRLLKFLDKHGNKPGDPHLESAWDLPAHVIPFFMKINGVTPPDEKVDLPSDALKLYRPYFQM